MLRKLKSFYLVGGTALALQIGHRKSIDFDLFKNKKLDVGQIHKWAKDCNVEKTLIDENNQVTYQISGVNITFLEYPFDVKPVFDSDLGIYLAQPLSIGAMKAYAIGRRSKWKDYVDIYFLLKQYSLKEIAKEAKKIFSSLFNEKIFREQLCYFEDIDFSEEVEFLDNTVSEKAIKEALIKVADK